MNEVPPRLAGRDGLSEILVIGNPAARGARAMERLKALGHLPPEVTFAATTKTGDARHLAAAAVERGVRTVVAAGGDGTINEVVNGIVGSEAVLGVLPMGTMNVFATELGISRSMHRAWAVIAAGKTREIDLGRANSQYFVQLAGAGFDAEVVKETTWDRKRDLGALAYLLSTAQVASRKPPRLHIEADGRTLEGCFVLIGNGRYYGGPIQFFRDARLDDGLLDLLVFQKMGHLDIARYFGNVVLQRHTSLPDVTYLQAREVRVSSEDSVPVEVDGELATELPVTFRISSRKLRVLAP